MSFSLAVYEALNDTGYRMQGQRSANRELRRQIAEICAKFPGTPGLETMRLEQGKAVYYPVIFALSTGGFLGMSSSNRCILGVSMDGKGVSSSRYAFDDVLIGYSDFNAHTIENVLRRALGGDPMSFDEWTQQRGQAGTNIITYGNDNTIGGKDATRW
ncbi:hypothetical protein [Microbacterium sp.]|uniref:hypothetical protein n=1 Tax=Microbacterium sp. TaxID=51671 RepID=UPI002899DEEA|nr:hypothetical protein [Microbacterium sp.]